MRFIISEWHKLKISSRLFTNKIRNPKNRGLGKRSKDKGQRNKVETWNNGLRKLGNHEKEWENVEENSLVIIRFAGAFR